MILSMDVAHPRKLIRDYVVALLTAAGTVAGTRVKATRVEPLHRNGYPAIAVYTLSEDSDDNDSAPIELTRELQLEVVGWVATPDPDVLDDAMDALAQQIEDAMAADCWLGGTAGAQMLAGTQMSVEAEDGKSDPLVGIVTLTYTITYRTVAGEVAADDFALVDAKQQIAGGVTDTPIAEDLITLEIA